MRRRIAGLEDEAVALSMTESAAARYRIERGLLRAAAEDGTAATEAERAEIEKLADAYQQANDAISYREVERSIREQTDALEQQAATFNMTEGAAARYRVEQQLLAAAAADGTEATREERQAIAELAGAYEAANDNLIRMQEDAARTAEITNFLRDSTYSFVSDLQDGLQAGEGFWDSFANAAENALNRINDKLLNEVLDSLFQVGAAGRGGAGSGTGFGGLLVNLFGGLFGGGGGSLATASVGVGGLYASGGVFGPAGVTAFARGGVVSEPTVFPFRQGIGLMGEAGEEAIMPLRRDRSGNLGVIAGGSASGAQPNVYVNVVTPPGHTADVKQSQTAGGTGIDVVIERVVTEKLSNPNSAIRRAGNRFGSFPEQMKGR